MGDMAKSDVTVPPWFALVRRGAMLLMTVVAMTRFSVIALIMCIGIEDGLRNKAGTVL